MNYRILITFLVVCGLMAGCADKPIAVTVEPPPPAPPKPVVEQEQREAERRARIEAERRARVAAAQKRREEQRRREAERRANNQAGSSSQLPPSTGSSFNDRQEFPWPPARPSSFTQVPLSLFDMQPNQRVVLGQLDQSIRRSLAKGGYHDASYYSIPGQPNAFALVTRLEKYHLDGSNVDQEDRWVSKLERHSSFSLGRYLKSLFFAEKGNYRIIVFVVTAQDIQQWSKPVQAQVAKNWIAQGRPSLPSQVQRQPMKAQHKVFALIYEFEKNCDSCENLDTAIIQAIPGRLQTKEHLSMTSVWE